MPQQKNKEVCLRCGSEKDGEKRQCSVYGRDYLEHLYSEIETKEPWEESVREMFVVGNMRFSGLSNDKLTPEKLIDFIRQLLTSAREEAQRNCDEITALARREERERGQKIRENEMSWIGHLQHRCPQCGNETQTPMTYLESYRINALWGRCFECVQKDNNQALADLSDKIK